MDITIVLPVSRNTYLRQVFRSLEFMNCNQDKIRLFVYVDGSYALFQEAKKFTNQSKFAIKSCVMRPNTTAVTANVFKRRKRIADIHNEIKEYMGDTKHILLVEDDTVIPPNGLEKLIQAYTTLPYAGFVSGVQLGRHGFLHVGAWTLDNVYEPSTIQSTALQDGLCEVDAAGFYFCLTQTDLYMAHTFKPFQKVLGPDTDYGVELMRMGYKNYVDYSIHCDHLTQKETIKVSKSTISQVTFTVSNNPNNKIGWDLTTKHYAEI